MIIRQISIEDILVVAPYNVQVNQLSQSLKEIEQVLLINFRDKKRQYQYCL